MINSTPAQLSTNQPSRQWLLTILKYAALITFTLIWLLPVLTAVVTSVRTNSDVTINGLLSVPQEIVFGNFLQAWQQAKVSQFMLNSFIITIPAVLFILFLASLGAYALARYKFRGDLFIYFLFVAGIMLPYQVLMLPVFKLSGELGIYNTHASLIIIQVAIHLAFTTFVLRNFMKSVPSEIMDAARVDGCNEFRIYWQIVLPLVLPGLAAMGTLLFTWVFNDYLWAIILSKTDSVRPIMAGLAVLRGQYQQNWPLMIAGALIATIPTLLVFFLLQRFFIQGLTLGSSK